MADVPSRGEAFAPPDRELAIRDLKEGSGLAHRPSGRFFANAAWLVIACLAHNLIRLVAALGLGAAGPVVAKSIRRRFVCLPGRITRSARPPPAHALALGQGLHPGGQRPAGPAPRVLAPSTGPHNRTARPLRRRSLPSSCHPGWPSGLEDASGAVAGFSQ